MTMPILDFISAASSAFAFLEAEFGFSATVSEPEQVRFDGNGVFVSVRFDGRRSYELGVEVGQTRGAHDGRERRFNLGEILRLAGSSEASVLASLQVNEQAALERLTHRMASALRTHGGSLLRGENGAFDQLSALSAQESRLYQQRNELRFAVEDARQAWKERDYSRVVARLGPFEQELSPSDRKRLVMSRAQDP